ncbi:hypothetical protein JCM5353_006573 [Sporobolomyces roseus]
MPASTAHPSTLPSFALMVSNNYLTSRLQTELNKNRKITFNVPMSLMVQFGDDPRCFLEDLFIKWWTEHFTPITAGYTVLDEKLNSGTERDIESVVATERHPQHGTERNEAQDQLVVRHEMDNLSCWSPIACAVLAANDLVRAQVNDPMCYLASILVVALTIWRRETPRFTFDDRKFAWNKTVGLLKAGNSPLLQVSFNNDIRRVCTDLAAIGDDNFHGFDDEVEAREGPGGGYISAAFIEVRSYTSSSYDGLANGISRTTAKLHMSLSSTVLSGQAPKELVEPLGMGDENLFCWSPVACAVLAVNDLIDDAGDDESKCHLAAIVWVALSIWNMEAADKGLKFQWNKTVGQLMAGKFPLLPRSYNSDIRRVFTLSAAVAFDEQVAKDGGPRQNYIVAAFEAIQNPLIVKANPTGRDLPLQTPSGVAGRALLLRKPSAIVPTLCLNLALLLKLVGKSEL